MKDKKRSSRGKILLICPLFAPVVTPRSIRWYYFSNYLAQKGFEVDVFATDPKSLDIALDNKSFANIHNNIIVNYINGNIIKYIPNNLACSKNKTFFTLTKMIAEIKIKSYYPDTQMLWALRAYSYVSKKININKYDYMIAVSNPISSLLVAYQISLKYSLKWVCDLGDPWTFNPLRNKGLIRRRIDSILERRIVERANKIVVTTEQTKYVFTNMYPKFKDKFVVITQGYDPELYKKKEGKRSRFIDRKRLNLVYTGQLYNNGRDGLELLQAIMSLGIYRKYVNVLFAGIITRKFQRSIKCLGLDKTVRYIGHLSLEEIADLQKSCDVLLYLGNDSKFQLPGKIFEYIGARKPILGIYYHSYDIGKKIIDEKSLGLTCVNERQSLKSIITTLIKLWQNAQLEKLRSKNKILDCEWNSNADRFYKLLNTI